MAKSVYVQYHYAPRTARQSARHLAALCDEQRERGAGAYRGRARPEPLGHRLRVHAIDAQHARTNVLRRGQRRRFSLTQPSCPICHTPALPIHQRHFVLSRVVSRPRANRRRAGEPVSSTCHTRCFPIYQPRYFYSSLFLHLTYIFFSLPTSSLRGGQACTWRAGAGDQLGVPWQTARCRPKGVDGRARDDRRRQDECARQVVQFGF